MVCTTCGATEGDFATRTRCMNCQRAIWRNKHATRMADPARAEARRQNLHAYALYRRAAGLAHPERKARRAE